MSDETPHPVDEAGLAAGAGRSESGPNKSFWEHLSDLRSALIRSVVAIGLALLVCLFLDSRIVGILEYPLRRIHQFEKPVPTVTLEAGSSRLGPFAVTKADFPDLPAGDAPQAVFRMGEAKVGGVTVLTLMPDPAATAAGPTPLDVRLHNLSPSEAFMVAFHVAIYAALAVSSPFWLYFLGGFLLPALNRKERSVVFAWLGWSVLLFLAGVLLTYFLLLPVALRASVEYSRLLGFDAGDWRADEYVSFACKFLLGMGVGFQFPLVVLFLVKLGILTHHHLARYRRHVAVLAFILGAVLTTPEVVTQVAMAIPLYFLYEVCIWIAWYWDRKKNRAAAGGLSV